MGRGSRPMIGPMGWVGRIPRPAPSTPERPERPWECGSRRRRHPRGTRPRRPLRSPSLPQRHRNSPGLSRRSSPAGIAEKAPGGSRMASGATGWRNGRPPRRGAPYGPPGRPGKEAGVEAPSIDVNRVCGNSGVLAGPRLRHLEGGAALIGGENPSLAHRPAVFVRAPPWSQARPGCTGRCPRGRVYVDRPLMDIDSQNR